MSSNSSISVPLYSRQKYLEDLEEECEDSDVTEIRRVKHNPKLSEAKVLLAEHNASLERKITTGPRNSTVYERVVEKKPFAREVSYSSKCRHTFGSFKGYVNKIINCYFKKYIFHCR